MLGLSARTEKRITMDIIAYTFDLGGETGKIVILCARVCVCVGGGGGGVNSIYFFRGGGIFLGG